MNDSKPAPAPISPTTSGPGPTKPRETPATILTWEAETDKHLFELLAGDWYGDNPTEKIDLIRKDKVDRAKFLCQDLRLRSDEVVLEIGSGIGFAARHIASTVRQLCCCDISESFLAYAKRECRDVPNISFHKIANPPVLPFAPAFFDAVVSDAVFIHLNLYDIYWYFSEFGKVVKPGGRVWINLMDDATMVRDKVAENAELYRKDPTALKVMLCWNSIPAVIKVASYFGFSLTKHEAEVVSVNLQFSKTGAGG